MENDSRVNNPRLEDFLNKYFLNITHLKPFKMNPVEPYKPRKNERSTREIGKSSYNDDCAYEIDKGLIMVVDEIYD